MIGLKEVCLSDCLHFIPQHKFPYLRILSKKLNVVKFACFLRALIQMTEEQQAKVVNFK